MSRRAVLGNLPMELTSFVGRRRELADVRRQLAESRLVTLVGVGGTGKTRLAVRAAGLVRRAFPDGAWFVDLTELYGPGLLAHEVQDPETLAFLVAATLGLHDGSRVAPLRRLTDHLADRQVLLLLDNCEHLLPPCAIMVDRLMRACPDLRVLATSREQLSVDGEMLFPVPPLSVPEPGQSGPSEAVTLFVERARAGAPGFELTAANRAAVEELCHRLDGLPLAVELAAARVRVLAPAQILDRLTDRFALLSRGGRGAPARQQTLRACMDWSFELCGKPERVLWARLSTFVGGFELDAVEGVCGDLFADDLLHLVAALVGKSVLVRDDAGDGPARYRMLETIRDYGLDRLAEAGRDAEMRGRHADWYAGLADRSAAEWVSARQPYWTGRLNREHPNLRAAVEHSLTGAPERAETAMHLAVTVPLSHWFSRGNLSEVRGWLGRALARTGDESATRAAALVFAGHLAIIQGDGEEGTRLLDAGEELAGRLAATSVLASAAYVRGTALLYRGEAAAAVGAYARTATILPARPVTELWVLQLLGLATAAALAGDHARAAAGVQEVLALVRPLGERRYRSFALWSLSLSAWGRGEVRDAMASLTESLRLIQDPGSSDRFGAARCIEAIAWVAARQGQHRRAATLLGAADAVWTEIGTPIAIQGHMAGDHEACERQVREALGDDAYAEAFRRGRELGRDDALAYALDERRQAVPVPEEDASVRLTRRERQVAELIAEGLSNREIAARLVISQRTAESHVENILTKLGFTNRAQVAAWKGAARRDSQT